jgi:hypothetical protein
MQSVGLFISYLTMKHTGHEIKEYKKVIEEEVIDDYS